MKQLILLSLVCFPLLLFSQTGSTQKRDLFQYLKTNGYYDYIEVFYKVDSITKIIYSGSNIGADKKVYYYKKEIALNGLKNGMDFSFSLPLDFFENKKTVFKVVSDTAGFLERPSSSNSGLWYDYMANINGNSLTLRRTFCLAFGRADYFTFIRKQ